MWSETAWTSERSPTVSTAIPTSACAGIRRRCCRAGTACASLTLNANWTIQLKNEGNYEGEEAGPPGATSLIGDFPEAFNASRHFPDGRLNSFQRHRARLWAIYTAARGPIRRHLGVGAACVSNRPLAFSLRAEEQPLTAIQKAPDCRLS